MVGSTDAAMFCELKKEAALLVVITGLGKGHPWAGFHAHLGLSKSPKHGLHHTHITPSLRHPGARFN